MCILFNNQHFIKYNFYYGVFKRNINILSTDLFAQRKWYIIVISIFRKSQSAFSVYTYYIVM